MKKLLSILLVLVMVLTCFAACGSKNESGTTSSGEQSSNNSGSNNTESSGKENSGTAAETPSEPVEKSFTYAMEFDIQSLDPQNSGDAESNTVNFMINEGLVRRKGNDIVPGLAEKWEVADDGLTYTFYLRDSVWSDGTPLTANDFIYSWQRMGNPEAPTYYSTGCEHIVNGLEISLGEMPVDSLGVEAPDDNTLIVHLKERDNNFIFNLASGPNWFPISKAADEAAGGLGPYGSEKDKLLTNGPFVVSEWSHEAFIVLEKNPLYWDADSIKLTSVKGIVGVTGSAAVDMMQAGEIDYMCTKNKKEIEELADAGFEVAPLTGSYLYLYFNGDPGTKTEAGKFMANTHFRRALNYCVNRVALCNVLTMSCTPAYRVITPEEPGVDGKTIQEMYPYTAWDINGEVDKAKEELAIALEELGVADASQVPPLYLLAYDDENDVMLLTAFQDIIRQQLGLESTVNPQAVQTMRELWHTGRWDVFCMSWDYKAPNWGQRATNWYRPADDPDDHEDNGYKCQAFDDMYEKYLSASSAEEEIKYLVECEKIFCEDAASAIVAWTTNTCCYSSKITGMYFSTSADFCFADIAE